MKAAIEITMDNAAFGDSGHTTELARIFRELADKIEGMHPNDADGTRVRDFNGNTVGTLSVEGIED